MTASLPRWLTWLAIGAIVLGCSVRFVGGGLKNYSADEEATSLRTSGVVESDYEAAVRGRVVTARTIQHFQGADAAPVGGIVHALAVDDPQHPPVYYLVEAVVGRLVGHSIAGRRLLGEIIGVLAIFAFYGLCRELDGGGRAWPLVATAFAATSPIGILYAQQAREYTLWGLLFVVSTLLLLRVARRGDAGLWFAYGVSIVVGLYSFLFFAFAIAVHGVVLVAVRASRANVLRYLATVAVAFAAFLPWLVNLVERSSTVKATTVWYEVPLPAAVYAFKSLFNLGAVFFDAEYAYAPLVVVLLPIAVLEAAAVVAVLRSRNRALAAFVSASIAFSIVPVVLPDLLLHQSRGTAARYFFPLAFVIEIAVAYALVRGFASVRPALRVSSALCIVAVLALGGVSWAAQSRAESWWPASDGAPVPEIARIVDERSQSAIVTSDLLFALLISNYVTPDRRFYLTDAADPSLLRDIPTTPSPLFFDPLPNERARVERQMGPLELLYRPPYYESPMLHRLRLLPIVGAHVGSVRHEGSAAVPYELWSVADPAARATSPVTRAL